MKKPLVIQKHHISYDPEVTVKIYKGEHFCLTLLQRRKNISRGLIKALDVFTALNRYAAVDLE